MRSLSAQDLLDVWDWGQTRSPARRVLRLLAAALPEVPAEQIESLRIGRRDRWLLGIRESLFGPSLACLSDCPQCRAPVELRIETHELTAGDAVLETGDSSPGARILIVGDAEIQWRPLECRDLLALEGVTDVSASRVRLLERAVVQVRRGGLPLSAEALTETEQAALLTALEQADPLARLECALTCPACGHQWQALFDIARFLWSELETVAHRLLYEVHALATAYGWSEAQILATAAAKALGLPGDAGRMSDLLTTLAARALGQGPVLRPCPADRFAPAAPEGGSARDPSLDRPASAWTDASESAPEEPDREVEAVPGVPRRVLAAPPLPLPPERRQWIHRNTQSDRAVPCRSWGRRGLSTFQSNLLLPACSAPSRATKRAGAPGRRIRVGDGKP